MAEDDLSGQVQSLRENFRGHVFEVRERGGAIEIVVPKGSPLRLPTKYRGFDVKRIEDERTLETPDAGKNAGDLSQFAVQLAQIEADVRKALELEKRVAALESAASSPATSSGKTKPPAPTK